MTQEYSATICKKLKTRFHRLSIHRPMWISRYDAGDQLTFQVNDVAGVNTARIKLKIEKFVGGGFAGQVYKVRVVQIKSKEKPFGKLKEGGIYAIKILIPPSGFSRLFRNLLYWIGFQGPFQIQINPAAARAGALWQKFIRRAAKIRFGDEKSVVDIYGLFVDTELGSCGELSEWIDGRTWRLEVDDRLDFLKQWQKGRKIDKSLIGSPEYRAKYEFMREFVKLLHDIGAHEFARQYEWSTCKSQPNCLKRKKSENSPAKGLVAVDFRAGLTLLPFLPMSPGDFKLILSGIFRGSFVQFDRGNIKTLERFIQNHKDTFSDMMGMLDDLKASEAIYRNSIPDITHNYFRIFYSKKLWLTMLSSAITGWKVRNILDKQHVQKFGRSKTKTLVYLVLGFIPVLGSFIRKIWSHEAWRKHYQKIITSWPYFIKAIRAKAIEGAIVWYRADRINENTALGIPENILKFFIHLPLSILPIGLHKVLTNWEYARERFDFLFVRPVRLYFDAKEREQWLRDMVAEGQEEQILTKEDAGIILSRIKEPFIQKYLKSLAVHVCTLPVTQVVSVTVAIIYVLLHPEIPKGQAWMIGAGIIALFQVIPISPGSLVRGFYVAYLVIKEKNFKDYNIAMFLGFFKYIGYLSFPIQMAYRYPVIARFMATHWANESVHIVPVFGEKGALLEHWVYRLFYNWPLTIRRRIQKRLKVRKKKPTRYWHIAFVAFLAAIIFVLVDYYHLHKNIPLPGLKDIWWLTLIVPILAGAGVTLGFGGASIGKRISGAAVCGVIIGILYTAIPGILGIREELMFSEFASNLIWRIFIFVIFSTIGAVITELIIPDPDISKSFF
ncbi:MAG: chloride channel protein [Desulfobacterales bacterium]|nr:chloride channel protein [Desulfobacterales bacterium]